MLLTATVQVAATIDDPMRVALSAVQLLLEQVLSDERSSLKLSVEARDNSRFMTHLKSFVAAHPDAHQNSLRGFCEVILTDAMSFADAVSFVAGLLTNWPDVLSSASLSFVAEEIRWRGTSDGSAGSLRLIDWNLLARRAPERRSTLIADLTCRGASIEDFAFVSNLQAAADASGIAFGQGQLSTSRDPQEVSPLDQRLAVEVGFQEALVRTSADILRKGIQWRGQPGLATYYHAVESRIEHWGEAKRISLPGPIKRFMKAEFPAFTIKKGRGLWFLKPITKELALHLVFDNDCIGSVGKAFAVLVGLEGIAGPLDGVAWRESLFRIFSVDRLQPCWIYSTADDLTTALNGLRALLHAVLAPLESSCRHFLDPLPQLSTLSGEIVRRGPITAREGWHEAIAKAQAWSREAALLRLSIGGEPESCSMLGPGLDVDGRLRPHGHWSYLFRSSEHPSETFVVEVPSIGSARSSLSGPSPSTDPPVGHDWLDTDRLLEICKGILPGTASEKSMERAAFLHCELRTGRSPIGLEHRGSPIVAAAPEPPPSDRWWTVEYRTSDRGRVRATTARLDAVSGGHIRMVEEVY